MCLGPLAYGHATATRIFLGEAGAVTGANDRESFASHPAGAEARGSDAEAGQEGGSGEDQKPARDNGASGLTDAVGLECRARLRPHPARRRYETGRVR